MYNTNTIYRDDFDPTSVLIDTFGAEFVKACKEREAEELANEVNYKISLIQSIAKNRKFCDLPVIEPKLFDKFLDMELSELEEAAQDFHELAILHARKNREFAWI